MIKKLKDKVIIAMIIIVPIFFWATIMICDFYSFTKNSNNISIQEEKQEEKIPDEEEILIYSENTLKKYLRDPYSYERISYNINKCYWDSLCSYEAIININYRAKNGFGGYNIDWCKVHLKIINNVIYTKLE